MRCLNCHKDGIAKSETSCPECGAYFPLLLREMLPAGTLLCNDTYRIHSPLDQGGFGIIYRAVHIALDSVVAIKEFYHFHNEYNVLHNRLSKHKNLVTAQVR